MSKFKLAFFDIDGTLAKHSDPNHITKMIDRVPQSTKSAIEQLKISGIEPVIATGRNHGMIKNLLDSLKIDSFIANNGRYVVFKDQKVAHDTFTKEQVKDIVAYFDQRQISYCFETCDHLFINENSNFLDDGSMGLEKIEDNVIPDEIIQMIVRSDEPFEVPIDGIQSVKVAPKVYDITMANSNKAVGINKILPAMDIRPEETLAFGDEENDIEMFGAVGFSVAMGNGTKKIKSLADYVTDSVDNNGIWNACKYLKLF